MRKTKIKTTTVIIALYYAVMISLLAGLWQYVHLVFEMSENFSSNVLHSDKTHSKRYEVLEVLNGTPMEDAVPYIKKAASYYELPVEMYLGISFAESSFKNFDCYNPWGIGVGNPRCYSSWEHSVNGFSQLMKYYYWNEGKITAEQMVEKYVGYRNSDWVRNVEKFYNPKVEVIIP